ncbi:unnamed protein product, partial [Rotaria sp. Silwood1]
GDNHQNARLEALIDKYQSGSLLNLTHWARCGPPVGHAMVLRVTV